MPWRALKIKITTLNWVLKQTSNQCSSQSKDLIYAILEDCATAQEDRLEQCFYMGLLSNSIWKLHLVQNAVAQSSRIAYFRSCSVMLWSGGDRSMTDCKKSLPIHEWCNYSTRESYTKASKSWPPPALQAGVMSSGWPPQIAHVCLEQYHPFLKSLSPETFKTGLSWSLFCPCSPSQPQGTRVDINNIT